MPTVFANGRTVVHKGSGGVTIAFPEVCKMIAAGPGQTVPIPYPNIAKTAIATQQRKSLGGLGTTVKPGGGFVAGTTGDEAGVKSGAPVTSKVTGKVNWVSGGMNVMAEGSAVPRLDASMLHARNNEASQLRSALDELHRQLRGLPPGNPDRWQTILQNYAVAASALYVTITDD